MNSNIFIYILTYDKFYRQFVIFQFKKKRGDVKIKYIKAYLEDNGEKYKSTLKQLFTKLSVSDFERIRVKVISSTFITFSKRNELRNTILKKSMRHKSDSYSKFLAEKRCKVPSSSFQQSTPVQAPSSSMIRSIAKYSIKNSALFFRDWPYNV